MKIHKLRPYTSMTMMVSMLFIAITGVILYIAPQGPGSRYWELLGLTKHEYKDVHLFLGILAICLGLLHGIINMRSINNYCKKKVALYKNPLLCASMVVSIIIVFALLF